MIDRRAALQDRFVRANGWGDATAQTVAGDASNRRYVRLTRADAQTAIVMDAPPDKGEDVTPFVKIATYLTSQRLSAPHIYAQDIENGFLLIEDLGDDLFARLMADDAAIEPQLYAAATDVLLALHQAPPCDVPMCDADWLTGMMDTVFDWYAPTIPAKTRAAFETAFHAMAQTLDHTPKVVILRDFHAENLLWLPTRQGVARVGLLDFQDALLGHPAYDLVSVLQDARRDVATDIETAMINRYLDGTTSDDGTFRTAYALIGLQRNLRILGIFARLGLRDGKPQYIDLIPRVWAYVERNLSHPSLAPLDQILHTALPKPTPTFLENLRSQCPSPPSPL